MYQFNQLYPILVFSNPLFLCQLITPRSTFLWASNDPRSIRDLLQPSSQVFKENFKSLLNLQLMQPSCYKLIQLNTKIMNNWISNLNVKDELYVLQIEILNGHWKRENYKLKSAEKMCENCFERLKFVTFEKLTWKPFYFLF